MEDKHNVEERARQPIEKQEGAAAEAVVPEAQEPDAIEQKAQEVAAREQEVLRRELKLEGREKLVQELLEQLDKDSGELARREAAVILKEQELTRRDAAMSDKMREQEEAWAQRQELMRVTEEEKLAKQREDAKQQLEMDLARRRMEGQQELTRVLSDRQGQALSALDSKIAGLREDRFRQLNEELERERTSRTRALEGELEQGRQGLERERQELAGERDGLAREQQELEQLRAEVQNQQANLDIEKARLAARERRLDGQEDRQREELDRVLADERASMEAQLGSAREEANRLRARLRGVQEELDACKDIQAVWGTKPSRLMGELDGLREINQRLREELAKRPSPAVEEECRRLRGEKSQLEERLRGFQAEKERFDQADGELQQLRYRNSRLEEETRALEHDVKEYKARCEGYRERLERLSRPENVLQGREERIQEIRRPYLRSIPEQRLEEVEEKDERTQQTVKRMRAVQPKDELEWLDSIAAGCAEYGISFPKRILYAFHTSLKISDWSTITVLAGVSGTGKSELPRLYSLFGGINFISVPVQPNWDSQESMLGYFNSIDNRFDTQPLLRFLAQCTNLDRNYPPEAPTMINPSFEPYPLGRYVSIVLLDEMNLAHVEHYFADFLSKLETRRGLGLNEVPTIEVKLGTGYEPFELRLARNVLWVGTMNQDETTKSLSDKVLDRGIMIHFPRPTTLNSRSAMKLLKAGEGTQLLEYNTWYRWCRKEIGFDSSSALQAEIDGYRGFVEDINGLLERSGRAIGHRVWQSIEFYLANYPTVVKSMETCGGEVTPALRAALHTAFEDQIVQKIMPKLRGIETRGEGRRQLEDIRQLLQDEGFEGLLEDFENACSRGYDQFVWNSAHYLEREEAETVTEAVE